MTATAHKSVLCFAHDKLDTCSQALSCSVSSCFTKGGSSSIGKPSGVHLSLENSVAFLSQCSMHDDSTPTLTSVIIERIPFSIRDSISGMHVFSSCGQSQYTYSSVYLRYCSLYNSRFVLHYVSIVDETISYTINVV